MRDASSVNHGLLRAAAACAAVAAGWFIFGPSGIVFAAPLVAVLLARPIINFASGSVRAARQLAFRSVEGTHYSFRGVPIVVWEDDLEQRWLATSGVRAVLPALPRDEVLVRVLPSGLQAPEGGTARYVRSDELVAFLAKAQQNDAVRFKNWVQRDVYYPSGSARRTGDRPTSAVSKKVG